MECVGEMGPKISWTLPRLPSHNVMFMLEALTFKVSVKCERVSAGVVSPESLVAQAWTNVYHRENPEGMWHAVQLQYLGKDLEHEGCFLFGNSVMLTSHGQYGVTFRVGVQSEGADQAEWVWAGGYGENAAVEVRPPTADRWTQGPDFTHIIWNVYLGNFIAATKADELGFDAVLNVADNLDLFPDKFCRPVLYHKIPMADGAHNPIPPDYIRAAVGWLRSQETTCKKILVNCRAGIGRAGSTVVAYVFAAHPEFSYQDAYQFVYQKRFVYPHKDLKETLQRLYR